MNILLKHTALSNAVAIAFLSLVLFFAACDTPQDAPDVLHDTTPYTLEKGDFPEPPLPGDNPLTKAGVQLGRMLFYEKRLSKDGSQACASCHLQAFAFTDTARFSIGVEGQRGHRQAMTVFNMAWNDNAFFWDGRAPLLRDQALLPIQDPLEMNNTLAQVIETLSADTTYTHQFKRAFGSESITEKALALALEQFMISIVSVNSKYDQYLAGQATLTESEERGRRLFMTEYNPFFPDESGADCVHCHGGANFENDAYMNNGLDTEEEMQDAGRQSATGQQSDKGKFKVSSLRNIALTAPYMHDGRFATLEEVVDHYDHGIQPSPTLDGALEQTREKGLMLTAQDKADLIAFLHTLTDQDLMQNPAYSSPF